MGGIGSGRSWGAQSRRYVDDNIAVDIRWLRREGLLVAGRHSNLQWSRNGEKSDDINVITGDGFIRLIYRLRVSSGDWQNFDSRVELDYTDCNYGGQRVWMLCPACGERCAKLYSAVPHFACRRCHNSPYQSQNESRSDRMARKARKVRSRLKAGSSLADPIWKKPKGMHWKTFDRLVELEKWANQESWIETALWLDKHYGVLEKDGMCLPDRSPPV